MATQGDRIIQYLWSFEPLEHMLATMPEFMIAFLILGIWLFFKPGLNRDSHYPRLLLVWLIFPILRISMPGQINFDGIRHYYEYLPAAAVIAGYGANYFLEWIKNKINPTSRVLPSILGLMIVSAGMFNYSNYYPYTYVYYNHLVGGITGAEKIFSENDTTDYWGISYREGLEWINAHAEQNSKIYVPVASWLVEIPAKIWMRQDLSVVNGENTDSVWVQENPVYVMFINRPGYYNNIVERILIGNQKPVFQRIVSGKPILFIYKIEPGINN
jgi:uncharacterized membrane protein